MSVEGWLSLLTASLVTYVSRAGFIVPGERVALPSGVRAALRFIPIAVLTAIAAPAILDPRAAGDYAAAPARALGAAIAAAIAWRFGNLPLALALGLATLAVAQLLGLAVE